MTSTNLAQLCTCLGIVQSFIRSRVSDDNLFSESQFKMLKCQPDYPGRFGSPLHTRAWLAPFFEWYKEVHRHDGLALFTPAEVFLGRVDEVATQRQVALVAAHRVHPERFVRGRPVVARPRRW